MSAVVTTGVSETPAVAADLFYYKRYFVKENDERVTKRYHYTTPGDRLSAVQHFLAGARNTTAAEVAKNFHPSAAMSIANWLLRTSRSADVKHQHSGFDAEFGALLPLPTLYELGADAAKRARELVGPKRVEFMAAKPSCVRQAFFSGTDFSQARAAHGSSSGKPGQAWRLGNLTADAEKRLRSERSATSWASLSAAEILPELKQDDTSYGATLRVLLSLSDATYEKFLSYDPSAKAKRNEVYVGISKYLLQQVFNGHGVGDTLTGQLDQIAMSPDVLTNYPPLQPYFRAAGTSGRKCKTWCGMHIVPGLSK